MNLRIVSKFATVLLFSGFVLSDAAAAGIQRSGNVTGPGGRQYVTQGNSSCAGGTCTSQQSVTGQNGRTATRTRTGQCSGGKCTIDGSVTGPRGRAVNRTSSFTRN